MKQSIIRAVDNMIVSINVKRDDAQSREIRAQSRVAAIPTKERQMLSIERQQKIKEALYLSLLHHGLQRIYRKHAQPGSRYLG